MSPPEDIVDNLLVRSHHQCCVCKTRRTTPQIHHADGDPSNNDPDNLIPLCPNCQGLAHTRFGLTRSYTITQLKKYRDEWFSLCEQKDHFAAGLSARRKVVAPPPTKWIVTYGVNTNELLESAELPSSAPRSYAELCDWLEQDISGRLSTRIRDMRLEEDKRTGETYGARFSFVWNPVAEEVDLEKNMEYWQLLELLPYQSVYGEPS